MLLREQRRRVVETGLEALRRGIVHGTAGNFSERDRESGLIAISPSGIPYPKRRSRMWWWSISMERSWRGSRRPSSETPMHTMIMRELRPCRCDRAYPFALRDRGEHDSAVFAAGADGDVRGGGGRVPVTRYGLTALDDIGQSVVEVMTPGSRAVIMRNHGLITFGQNVRARRCSIRCWSRRRQRSMSRRWRRMAAREPNLVPEELVEEMTARFDATYGQPQDGSESGGAARDALTSNFAILPVSGVLGIMEG